MAKLERKDQGKRQKPNQGADVQRQSQLRAQGAGCPASHRKEVK
jgi:hypothetical protein